MSKIDVIDELKQRFLQPLPDFRVRRVVIWHDADGEFAERFEELSREGFDGAGTTDSVMPAQGDFARPVRFMEARDGVMFETKRMIARGDTASDILLYRPCARGSVGGDWLADVELYADHFQADYLSLLADQLGATNPDAVREVLGEHKVFFSAKDRVRKFSACMPAPATKEDIELGMLAATFGGASPNDASASFILRGTCTALLHDGPEELARLLGRYDAQGCLASFIARRTGFTGPLTERDSLEHLAAHVLLTAASYQNPAAMHGLESHIAAGYEPYCMTAVREWMQQGKDAVADLFEICSIVEDSCGLRARLKELSLESSLQVDIFPCVNEVLVAGLLESFAQGADRVADAREVLEARRGLAWYGRLDCYFDILSAITDMRAFQQEHASGFHVAYAKDAWDAYTQNWWRMDAAYRHLCCAYERCKLKGVEALEAAVHAVMKWAEGLYRNWYLVQSNACWTSAASAQWRDCGYVEGVDRQDEFYWKTLPAHAGAAKTCVVLISDALRYEVAQEVAQAFERERGGSVASGSMQALFPSITEMGMAALLPHQGLTLDWDAATVAADGMPTVSTPQREAVLQKVEPTARAMRAEAYLELSAPERRALLKESKLVYLYHNKIDAAGEKMATESDVFKACEDTVEELVSITRRVCLDASSARVVITADHGFLYTAQELEEHQFLIKADLPDDPFLFGKRHVVLRHGEDTALPDDIREQFIVMNMDGLGLGRYVGLSPRETMHFKRPGGTHRYVHGGASLQELCVPVIGYRRLSASSKEFEDTQKATLRVLSESRRITSMLFGVSLLQNEAACGKTLPCSYELSMTDASGNAVSDVVTVAADRQSENPQERVIKIRLSLKTECAFSSKEPYFLVARDAQTGAIVWREEYKIDIAFASGVDFGF